ncbi:iron-siderophore ABC transporter substrate-binding protein [Leifsonia poae]|uniref:iron-siderophore ABC transporter substrate-binding protein n=1 Tax=Leifsonia poae TaxID=110933 RepID=UPI001CBADEA0|nr:iron-siderophore ABC transporter substrate-binding protein [Leifsonia poae]
MFEFVARGRRRRSRIALIASAIVASTALALTGCSTAAPATDTTASSDSGAFPVTITSALGSVTIDKTPTRIATWGWGAQDAVLALGMVPVAMPKNTYGGNADGVLPWDAEQIKKLGGKTPELLSGTDTSEVPFEQFVQAKPDVILAPYSGLSQKDYDTLSKIAPVVAYPKDPWATSWQDQLTIVGKALGKSAEAAKLKTQVDDKVAALAAKYPVLKGKTFVYISANEPGKINIFRSNDPRVQLLNQLGMKDASSTKALDSDPKAGSYFYSLSNENLSKIDADLLVGYFADQAAVDAFTSTPLVAAMPTVADGRFAPIAGESFVMASSAPSVLSIPWMLDSYVPQLAAAAEKVK